MFFSQLAILHNTKEMVSSHFPPVATRCDISKIVFWAYKATKTIAASQISSIWKAFKFSFYPNSFYFRLLPLVWDMLLFLLSHAFTLISLTAQIGFAHLWGWNYWSLLIFAVLQYPFSDVSGLLACMQVPWESDLVHWGIVLTQQMRTSGSYCSFLLWYTQLHPVFDPLLQLVLFHVFPFSVLLLSLSTPKRQSYHTWKIIKPGSVL